MPYSVNSWTNGDVVTKAKLDRLESAASAASSVYYAATYGILPSVTDNSAALNNLISLISNETNSTNGNNGGVIVFGPGNYGFGSTINLRGGVYLSSLMPNHGYIAANPTATGTKFSANGTFSGSWLVDTPSGGWSMGLLGIDLQGNGSASLGGIRLQGVYWGAVKNSMANQFGLSGFRQESPSSGGSAGFACVYEDLMATNCVNSGQSAIMGAMDLDGTDHYINRCEVTSGSQNNTLKDTANGRCAAFVLRGSNHFVDNSVFETSDYGAVIYATKSRITSCRADTNNGHGWYFIGGSNTVTGCDAIGNGQAGTNTYDDFIVDNAAWGTHMDNCHSRLAGSKQPRNGFNIQTNVGGTSYGGGYDNCTVEGAQTPWYFPNGNNSGVGFLPYTIKPSSGATFSVSQTSGMIDLSNFSAATTVTNFTDGVNGQSIRLVGNTNVTIANNTTIKTNTAANKTLAANRIYTFNFLNGVWYENSAT